MQNVLTIDVNAEYQCDAADNCPYAVITFYPMQFDTINNEYICSPDKNTSSRLPITTNLCGVSSGGYGYTSFITLFDNDTVTMSYYVGSDCGLIESMQSEYLYNSVSLKNNDCCYSENSYCVVKEGHIGSYVEIEYHPKNITTSYPTLYPTTNNPTTTNPTTTTSNSTPQTTFGCISAENVVLFLLDCNTECNTEYEYKGMHNDRPYYQAISEYLYYSQINDNYQLGPSLEDCCYSAYCQGSDITACGTNKWYEDYTTLQDGYNLDNDAFIAICRNITQQITTNNPTTLIPTTSNPSTSNPTTSGIYILLFHIIWCNVVCIYSTNNVLYTFNKLIFSNLVLIIFKHLYKHSK